MTTASTALQTRPQQQAAQNTYHYNIDYFAADELYNEGGIRLVTEVLYTNDENEQYLMLEFEN